MNTDGKLILRNGKVFTADDQNPWAEAFAIQGNEITAVGSNDEIEAIKDANTEVIDLEGMVALPGFNDAHTHYIWALIGQAASFDLHGIRTIGDAQMNSARFCASRVSPDRQARNCAQSHVFIRRFGTWQNPVSS